MITRPSTLQQPTAGAAPAGRVFVALSGGVDSAVALALSVQSGAPVEALFMKSWEEDDAPGYCAAAEDLADAESVCRTLDVVLHTVNFATEYWDRVFERFVAEYRAARTPNPDVLCNQEVKFDVFLQHALDLGADELATGHYARVDRDQGGRYRLLAALDQNKDQSFFLHRLNQAQLSRVRFPVGELTKPQVRVLAAELGLAPHDKKDSTGICFIGERPFREFLARYVEHDPGPIRTVAGKVVGQHVGLSYYTVGQRQGLGIGGQPDGHGQPWYVAGKDRPGNALIVAQGRDHPALHANALYA
ncbi:MAG: tRNA 2-thiouridine(34) synthase MnmA, partial [Gammaproteobacteria bacterium]